MQQALVGSLLQFFFWLLKKKKHQGNMLNKVKKRALEKNLWPEPLLYGRMVVREMTKRFWTKSLSEERACGARVAVTWIRSCESHCRIQRGGGA